jgi:hypothetical protein
MTTGLIAVRIEIERPSTDRLVIKNDRTTPLTLTSLREPARQSRVGYAPTSDWQDGEAPLSVSWQQSLLGFDVAAREAATEALAQAYIDELAAAVHPLEVVTHVFYEGGLERIWRGHGGSVAPTVDRDYVNLRDHDPVWSASLPCHPIPVAP